MAKLDELKSLAADLRKRLKQVDQLSLKCQMIPSGYGGTIYTCYQRR